MANNNKNCKQCHHFHRSVFKDDYGTFFDTWCKKHPEKDIQSMVGPCEDFEKKRERAKRRSAKEDDIL